MDLTGILAALGLAGAVAEPFRSAEDGSEYQVWKVTCGQSRLVLKKAKGRETEIYSAFFRDALPGAPRFLGSACVDGQDYFLMEFVQGEDLCKCSREPLRKALDALIALQDRYWEDRTHRDVGQSFEASLEGRRSRGKYLNDPILEQSYGVFLDLYAGVPRTLCHDDLLPFNVLVSESSATIIDWEAGGILPYPTSLARLIAHGTDDPGDFFCMSREDRAFAIDYYYEHLAAGKGISYADYRRTLDYFLLYEYCEWIMLGNKYPDADMTRYHSYLARAKAHIGQMQFVPHGSFG